MFGSYLCRVTSDAVSDITESRRSWVGCALRFEARDPRPFCPSGETFLFFVKDMLLLGRLFTDARSLLWSEMADAPLGAAGSVINAPTGVALSRPCGSSPPGGSPAGKDETITCVNGNVSFFLVGKCLQNIYQFHSYSFVCINMGWRQWKFHFLFVISWLQR